MPSEPRVPTEPTLEELSALIDNELDAAAQARVAEHVAGCQECQARLDGLRQTAHAIRGLPMETPPRTFTIPAQRRQAWRWAPVGWLGGAAAALLVIAFGVQQLHFPAGAPSSGTSMNYSAGSPTKSTEQGAPAPASSALDRFGVAAAGSGLSNVSSVVDPGNGLRGMSLATDGASFSATGVMKVSVVLVGSPSSTIESSGQGLKLTFMRGGSGVALADPVAIDRNGTPIFAATYELARLPLTEPRAGDYRLVATWIVPDGSGRVLQASVPIRLTGS
jgi:putative zinc finger protein